LYFSPNIVLVVQLRKIRWAEYAARMVSRQCACVVLVSEPKIRYRLEDLGVDARTKLKCTLQKSDGKLWIGLMWLRMWVSNGLL
jgi:hypothetical protein